MRELGTIVKPQGIKGELKVLPAGSHTEPFKKIKEVNIDNKVYEVKSSTFRQGFGFVTLAEITSREDADKFRNKKMFVKDEEFNLSSNEFFIEDIVGSQVYDEEGNFIGTLVDVEQFGSADVFVINEENREQRIPFILSIVTKVNNVAKIIVVNRKAYDEVKLCE